MTICIFLFYVFVQIVLGVPLPERYNHPWDHFTGNIPFASQKIVYESANATVCQWETVVIHCETYKSVIIIKSAIYGRMHTLYKKCIQNSYGFQGCYKDVSSYIYSKCFAQKRCTITLPDFHLDKMGSCPDDLKSFLIIQYVCLKIENHQKVNIQFKHVHLNKKGFVVSKKQQQIFLIGYMDQFKSEMYLNLKISIYSPHGNDYKLSKYIRLVKNKTALCHSAGYIIPDFNNDKYCLTYTNNKTNHYELSIKRGKMYINGRNDPILIKYEYEYAKCEMPKLPPKSWHAQEGNIFTVGCIWDKKNKWRYDCISKTWENNNNLPIPQKCYIEESVIIGNESMTYIAMSVLFLSIFASFIILTCIILYIKKKKCVENDIFQVRTSSNKFQII